MKGIIQFAFDMTEAVHRLRERVKQFYYAVVLSGHRCPRCNGGLMMTAESRARCGACSHELDPTATFQRCICGGVPELRIRRYCCQECAADIHSLFVFDSLVFDAEYFREKMAESRERNREQRDRVRQLLAESRSNVVQPEPAALESLPGLLEALNALTQGLEPRLSLPEGSGFSLKRYQNHVQAHLQPFPVSLREIPPLGDDARKDLIWRFIAILFLAQAGIVEIWQDGQDIMVKQRETDTEGQGVPGELEEADGLEGVVD